MLRLFVYGTLKRGLCRHRALAQQQFLGTAQTEADYRLFDLGDYPGMVYAEKGSSIAGELYFVDESCLEELDKIEGVDEGLYRRNPVKLLPPWNSEPAITYIYLHSVEGCREVSKWPPAAIDKTCYSKSETTK